ncbi:hypothetical protein A0J50_14310 [Acinetobacter sp. DUT-2]|nr:hypothetical protein A0J50_14310 [Acinetobacter sp. DUT-2]
MDLKRKSNTQKKHCKSSAFLYLHHNKKDDLIFSVQFYLRQLLYLLKEIQFLNFMYFLVLEISSSLLKHAITQDAVMITMNRKIE